METLIKDNPVKDFKKKCREKNLKITPQRTIIYEELAGSKDHPSVEILYKRVRKKLPDISFDTVYRTLQTFNAIGIAKIVEGVHACKRFDGNTSSHFHFICQKCGNIEDIFEAPFDYIIPEIIKEKFNPESVRILFEGTCSNCL